MVQFFKSTAVFAVLLFSVQGAQAGLMSSSFTPPGLTKSGHTPPGLTKSGHTPPGHAKSGVTLPDVSENLGLFTAAGTVDSDIYSLPTDNPSVNWYEFALGDNLIGLATVTLDTELPYVTSPYNEYFIDTVLALYTSRGSLILNTDDENQNDDCPTGVSYSCGTFSLGAGTYIAGVTDGQFFSSPKSFKTGFGLEDRIEKGDSFTGLSIAVEGEFGPVSVPEPATLWLLSLGLLGLIGVARRARVES